VYATVTVAEAPYCGPATTTLVPFVDAVTFILLAANIALSLLTMVSVVSPFAS
jgi:hypothetical protein